MVTTYAIGSRVRTNRTVGQTDYAATATVEAIRTRPDGSPDYVIRYDVATGKAGDLAIVSRSANALRPL